MYNEQSVKPQSPAFLKGDSTQFNKIRETFHDVVRRTLNYNSSSRPPKTELTGILVPLEKPNCKFDCRFKLETDQSGYLLRMSDAVLKVANKLDWEEVTVKGYLDPAENVFEVATISIANRDDPNRPSLLSLSKFNLIATS